MDEQSAKTRLQVVAHMTKLLKALDFKPSAMEKQYGVNRRHVEKFILDQWSLTSREELQVLMTLAKQYGFDFLSLEPDEVWRTFGEESAATFVSRKKDRQRPEDLRAMTLLVDEGISLDHPETEGVLEKMRDRNTVLIGSPKHNEACGIALKALGGNRAEAGVAASLPFRFIWNDWRGLAKESRFCGQAGPNAEAGLEVLVKPTDSQTFRPKRGEPTEEGRRRNIVFLKANLPKEGGEYGWDFGVFVMCRKPLSAEKNVTTVMLGGITGFATEEISRELSRGLLFLHPDRVQDGRPLWRILCCPWTREGRRVSAHSGGRRWLDPDDIRGLRDLERDCTKPPPRRGTESGNADDK